jgi:hypothetical protein
MVGAIGREDRLDICRLKMEPLSFARDVIAVVAVLQDELKPM